MKTSNKLLLTTALIILISMAFVDFELKAKYVSMKKMGLEKYRKENRFKDYKKAQISNFDAVEIKSANALEVVIEYGEKPAVWLSNGAKDAVQVTQKGNTLSLDLNKRKDTLNRSYGNVVIIVPRIVRLTTSAMKLPPKSSDGPYREFFETRVIGFNADSLKLVAGGSTVVNLENNSLKSLKATVGDDADDAKLFVHSNNNIESVSIDARRKSKVELLDNEIKSIKHRVSDSATVTFRGFGLQKLERVMQ